ncbi:MAG: SH3 domain-containing protein, partial [Anaerolineae bacterium]|nr:SH3 domain-containing protein [Anaerolineae bacterium]
MRRIILVMAILLMGVFSVQGQAPNARVIEMWEALNMREAPSDDAAVVAELAGRTPLFVSGRTRDNRWYAAQTEDGVSGWVASGYIELLSISQNQLPILDASAPAPQPQPQTQETQPETSAQAAPEATNINARVAAGMLNLRAAPDTRATVLSILPQGTGVQAIGRSADTSWIQVQMGDGTVGWLAAAYLATTIEFAALPVVGADPVPQQETAGDTPPAQTTTSNLDAYFVLGANARPTFARGQQLGNHANVFSKVGDSITAEELMFRPFGYDRYTLGGYGYLQSTIDFYRNSSARTDNSFNNESLAARGGWTTASVLDTNFANRAVCEQNETPLACEYRLNHPAVALIMFGSNDMIWLTTD